MTRETEKKLRTFFGWAAMTGALFLTALTGYRAHLNTMKETARLTERQDLIYGITDSESYPLVVLSSKGDIIQWNDGMTRLTGVNKEEAQAKGLSVIMCDPLKEKQHDDGLKSAFTSPVVRNKLTLINCSIKNAEGKKIPVRIAVRMISTSGGNFYALARIDPESQIVEYGTPKSEKLIQHRLDNIQTEKDSPSK